MLKQLIEERDKLSNKIRQIKSKEWQIESKKLMDKCFRFRVNKLRLYYKVIGIEGMDVKVLAIQKSEIKIDFISRELFNDKDLCSHIKKSDFNKICNKIINQITTL